MATNYNSSVTGTPYVRVCNVQIQYPDNGVPTVTLTQELAVKLIDGSIAQLSTFPSIVFNPDMANNATTPINLVDPTTGANLTDGNGNPVTTTLQQVMLCILAAIRQQQLLSNP